MLGTLPSRDSFKAPTAQVAPPRPKTMIAIEQPQEEQPAVDSQEQERVIPGAVEETPSRSWEERMGPVGIVEAQPAPCSGGRSRCYLQRAPCYAGMLSLLSDNREAMYNILI